MKNFSKLLISILFCLALFSCDTDEGKEGVRVKLTNKTGQDITNLVVNNIPVGNLANEQSTKYLLFDKFRFDTGMPDADCRGTISGEKIESFNQFYFCGTEKTTVEKGKYEFDIQLVDSKEENKKYLKLIVSK